MRIRPVAIVSILAAWGALAAFAAVTSRPVSATDSAFATRTLTASVPAAGLTRLALAALDGSVDLRTAADADAAVTISVTLVPPRLKNFRLPPSADLERVALATTVRGEDLRVGLTGAGEGNVEATWTITVPMRFSAEIDAHDGRIDVKGLEGGVAASLNSGLGGARGDLVVNVPRGSLALTVGVGRIDAHAGSSSFGSADVRAEVGDARLFMLGHEIVGPHAPGPGHRVRLDGSNGASLTLSVTVGDATLHIG